jgi:cytochrome P450
MLPAVPYLLRKSPSTDDEILGYKIPKNSPLILNNYAIHYNPKFWKDPYEFKPERWYDLENKDLKFNYLPFGGGPNDCLGKNLASVEAPMIVFLMIQKYQFSFPENFSHENVLLDLSFVSTIKNVQMKITKRE